jgi:hypothetical protein
MRLSPAIGCLALAVVCTAPLTASAQTNDLPESVQIERRNLRRALEMAQLDLRLYLQVDYPRELRHLDSAIRLTQAEVDAVKARLRAYGPYTRFDSGQPFTLSIQDDKLCLLDAELRLQDLKDERCALVRFHSDHWRLLELKAQDIRDRLVQLEGGEEIVEPASI